MNRREILKSLAAVPIIGWFVPKPKPMTLGGWAKINTKKLGPARIEELKQEHSKYKQRRKTKILGWIFRNSDDPRYGKAIELVGGLFGRPKN